MKDNRELYFDIWRKAGFRDLVCAYVEGFQRFPKAQRAAQFGAVLDRYVEGGRGTYDGSSRDWSSAYTLAREFGVYSEQSGVEVLSAIAVDLHRSDITPAEYLANWALNFNQLIAGKVVHPLSEVLGLFAARPTIGRRDVESIPAFRLSQARSAPSGQTAARILCNRLAEADLLKWDKGQDVLSEGRWPLQKAMACCRPWTGTAPEFAGLDHEGYVKMLSYRNPLVYS